MQYSVGDGLVTKKPHACGGNEWTVIRTGADIKLKCNKCGRAIFLSVDQVDKMKKNHISGENQQNG
jgi:hypothetical protein